MSLDSEQSAIVTPSGGEICADERIEAFRESARLLLESQRAKFRSVDAALREQAASLIEIATTQEQTAARLRQELKDARESLDQQQAQAHADKERLEQAEQLLAEAEEGLRDAMNQQAELRAELAGSQETLAAQSAAATHGEVGNCQAAVAENSQELAELLAEIDRLERERNDLQKALEQAEASNTKRAVDSDAAEVLRERFEMAVQELRELKVKNEELAAENNSLRADGKREQVHSDSETNAGGFDWESTKQALMDQMESDFDPTHEEQAKAKLTIEGAIRITDQVVAEKDSEIEELQGLLANQSSSLGDMAVGAAAIADILDHDDLVREERENLKRLQEEWREKLRQAEVEIAVERAKFARDRTELDEQVRNLEGEKAAMDSDSAKQGKRKPRGNWLSRLGLKDDS